MRARGRGGEGRDEKAHGIDLVGERALGRGRRGPRREHGGAEHRIRSEPTVSPDGAAPIVRSFTSRERSGGTTAARGQVRGGVVEFTKYKLSLSRRSLGVRRNARTAAFESSSQIIDHPAFRRKSWRKS